VKAVADGLLRLDGVADVKVDLQANRCTIAPAPDRVVDLAGVPIAVDQAGFLPERMWLEARGRTTQRDGATWFVLDGTELAWKWEGPAHDGLALARVERRPEVVLVPDTLPFPR
jgi:hypothetical protein